MKKLPLIIVLALATFIILISCKTEEEHPNSFTITGEIKGLSGNLFFRHPDKEYTRETPVDTIKVINGKIQFSDTISKLALITVFPSVAGSDKKLFKKSADGKGFFPSKSTLLMFYAFPGATISIKGEATDFMNAYPSGDVHNNLLAAINTLTYPKYNEMGNLAVANSAESDSLRVKENNERSELIFKANTETIINHIQNNPKSLAGLWYLNDMLMRRQIDNTKAEKLFTNLSKELSEFEDYKRIASRIEGIKSTKEGFPVPSIKTTATLNGKLFDINSLRDKYVLIDFWGIWCGPCVAEMPEVKAFQEKYKDKLVVLGINSGDSKGKIKKFIDKNGYDWIQLMSDKANTSDNFVARFNVQGFPTKFIIDPKGNIVKRFVGGGEEAFELLENMMAK